jgi:hypothetical protein
MERSMASFISGKAAAALFVLALGIQPAAAQEALSLTCSGKRLGPQGAFATETTVNVQIAQNKPVTLSFVGQSNPIQANVTSNNAVQLQFTGPDFAGEYFYFSGDLFLIHKVGELTPLRCRPAK